ncbi:MAG: hypothetical protein JXL84_17395 [Deltaproteobacteria bacterium]|nr:hypothetical protein [Deltaproteobacteria bacterium]
MAQSIGEIRNKLAQARQKWTDSAALLARIREEVSRYLTLRKMSEEDFHATVKSLRTEQPQTVEGLEELRRHVLEMAVPEMRRIFIEADHLLNLPMVKQRDLRDLMSLPSFTPLTASRCTHCGAPIPKGKRKYCSELCRSSSRVREEGVHSAFHERPPSGQVRAGGERSPGATMRRGPTPHPGEGDRNLDCVYYEACLDLAVLEDWESFHCEGCGFRKTDEGGYSSGRTPLQ